MSSTGRPEKANAKSERVHPYLETHLEARIQALESAMNGGDLEAVMAFFAADPVVSPHGQEFRGADAARQVLSQPVSADDPIDLAVSRGTEGEGTFEQTGLYLVDDGSDLGVTGVFTADWTWNAEGEWLISKLSWTQE